METFASLLEEHRGVLERFVKLRIASHADAEDVLQEISVTAYRKFHHRFLQCGQKPGHNPALPEQ